MMDVLSLYILWFVVGVVVGSFLNVCILRIPRGQSVVIPGSSCPQCKQPVRWFDNVPLLNFVWLKARCRWCGSRLSWRYPLVECLNGLGYLAVAGKFGFGMSAIVYALFLSALLVVTMIDFDHLMIPDVISLPGIVIGFVASTFIVPVGWHSSLIGIALGGGILWILAILSPYLFGKEGLGGGDIKCLAMIGAFLGWQNVLLTLFLASFAGAVVGVSLMAFRRIECGQYLPFGPFLATGAVVSLFCHRDIFGLYADMFW